jgi:hypothetical protein
MDPTKVRLSDNFLLSDFLGCDSVYTHGYRNAFQGTPQHHTQGTVLCRYVLEPLLKRSRLSISYGYISPELSRKIVKYQSPDKPSYHRWDAGAACDIVLHDMGETAPIDSAFWIDENLPVSRVITYSESPFICVASRYEEIRSGDPRRALYENRYVGGRKPQYISYSNNPTNRRAQKKACCLEHDWRGAGYPTYHGGGREQLQHIRTSLYTVLTDFLYSTEAVTEGLVNKPPQRSLTKFRRAGKAYDHIITELELPRLSIVRGYESPSWSQTRHTWTEGVYFAVMPPEYIDPEEIARVARSLPETDAEVADDGQVTVKLYAGVKEVRT